MRILQQLLFFGLVGALASVSLHASAQTSQEHSGANGFPSLTADECSITGAAGVPCNIITSNAHFKAGRADPGTAVAPIDIWNICRYVDNVSIIGRSHPVFWNTAPEWQHTVNSTEHDFTFTRCALPWTPPAPPADGDSNSSTYCASSDLVAGAGPTAFPYDRVGNPAHSASAQYTCHCADGVTIWTQTAAQFYLPVFLTDNDGVLHTTNMTSDVAGWQISGNVKYTGTKPPGCDAPGAAQCGLANGQQLASAPADSQLCDTNSALNSAAPSGSGPWNWSCKSKTNSSSTVTCSAQNLSQCGTASGTPAPIAPTTNLCTDGSTPPVSHVSGYWTWSCDSNNCQASITTPSPIRAGCDVDLLMHPNGTGGEKANDETNANCSGIGYSSGDQVVMSVGTTLESNPTCCGTQHWWDFGEFKSGNYNDVNRYRFSWAGPINAYGRLSPTMDYYAGSPVPNGDYTEYVTVTDTYNGQQQTLSVHIHKETSPPICPTCSVP